MKDNLSQINVPYQPYAGIEGVSLVNDDHHTYLALNIGDKTQNLRIRDGGYIPKSGLLFKDILPHIVSNKHVLDLGCGELGIISVMSLMAGARCATAVDIDPVCTNWLTGIKKRNKLDTLIVNESNMFQNVSHQEFDVIVSNPPIMPMLKNNKVVHDSGGPDGRRYLLDILYRSQPYLSKHGTLLLLAFAFLGTTKRTNKENSLNELAIGAGFSSLRVLKEVDKEIKPGSVTYQNLDYIQSVYPHYSFKRKNGKVFNTIQILQFEKTRI